MTKTITQELESQQVGIVVDAVQRAEWRRLYGYDNATRLLLDYVDQLERRLGISGDDEVGLSTAWVPTHAHYKGELVREIGRAVSRFVDYPAGDWWHNGRKVWVTDSIMAGREMVEYENRDGRRFLRPAYLFDGTIDDGSARFAPIPDTLGVRLARPRRAPGARQ